MTRRSRAREVALQLLFQKDQNPKPVGRAALVRFARERLLRDDDAIVFCLALYDGVSAHQADIDKQISETAENWRLTRMKPVDRNLLRLGAFEVIYAAEPTPTAVTINEAVELARRFGAVDSPAFVNGILDKMAKSKGAAPGTPGETAPAETKPA